MGISLGGFLAPRAAAFEHRLAALVANDGLYTFRFGEKARAVTRAAALFGRRLAQYALPKAMKRNSGAIEHGMFTFHACSIWDLIEATKSWSLEGAWPLSVLVEPDFERQLLVVVTAYRVWD